MARNLADANNEEIREFLGSFDNILFDCDGVLMWGEKLIPGVKESIECLRNKNMKLITNNAFRTTGKWDEIFDDLKLNFTSKDVIFPTRAVIGYLREHNFQKEVFVLGHPAITKELTDNGIQVYDYKYCGRMKDISEVPENVKDEESVGAVVVDLDFDLTYMKLMKAGTILKRKDVLFIVCATDKTAPIDGNLKIIGSHFIAETLKMISGRSPVVLGKPSVLYDDYVRRFFAYAPERTLFVGDSLLTDMLFATRCGYKKLLVLSGTTSYEDMLACPKEFAPKWYLNSLSEIHSLVN